MLRFAAMLATAAVGFGPLGLPGAAATPICGAAGPYWPTMTLAVQGSRAWVACKEQSRVIAVDPAAGKTAGSIRLRGPVTAVATGLGAVWALEGTSTLVRVDPVRRRVLRRISLPAAAAYNVFLGGGSVWVADDQGAKVIRVSPRTNRVVASPRVGNGPADMAFNGASAWVINHRDRVLTRIDLHTNRSRRVAVLPGDAPERMVWSAGRLWVTGRGTDLLKVNPANGSVESTIEIGGSGIDIAAAGDTLWVPTRSAAVDQTGFPTMDALKRVSVSTGAVSVAVEAEGRVDVHGLAAANGAVWIADNTSGTLYRFS